MATAAIPTALVTDAVSTWSASTRPGADTGPADTRPAEPAAGGGGLDPSGAVGSVLGTASPGRVTHRVARVAARSGVDGGDDPNPPGPPVPCPSSAPAGGWSVAENRRPSTASLRVSATSGPYGDVLGYLDTAQTTCGATVAVHLGGRASGGHVRIAAYRVGWYGGAGSRRVWESASIRVVRRPVPAASRGTGLVQPAWPVSTTVAVDGAWSPGFYLLVPRASGRPAGPAMPLVVNDPTPTPVLFMASTLTWNAYDDWGGRSLYNGPGATHARQVANRARVVALHRPLIGNGYRQLLSMDLPVVRLAEHLASTDGLAVAYTTDQSVDAAPAQLASHAELLIGGHSEYWTRSMYDGLLAARGAGLDVAFLGANNLWWQARLEGGSASSGPDREAVYRTTPEDPMAGSDAAHVTVLWSSALLHRDPATVLGQSHAAIGVAGGLQVVSAPAWFTAGTRLRTGSLLPGVVGNEADGYNPAAANPPSTQVLAAGVLLGSDGPVTVSVSYSTTSSGSAVFAAGTTDWACELDGGCPGGIAPAFSRTLVRALTRNVVLALAAGRAGLAHPASSVPVPTAAVLRARLSATAVGRYGLGDDDERRD
jgi:hypothetical protein